MSRKNRRSDTPPSPEQKRLIRGEHVDITTLLRFSAEERKVRLAEYRDTLLRRMVAVFDIAVEYNPKTGRLWSTDNYIAAIDSKEALVDYLSRAIDSPIRFGHLAEEHRSLGCERKSKMIHHATRAMVIELVDELNEAGALLPDENRHTWYLIQSVVDDVHRTPHRRHGRKFPRRR